MHLRLYIYQVATSAIFRGRVPNFITKGWSQKCPNIRVMLQALSLWGGRWLLQVTRDEFFLTAYNTCKGFFKKERHRCIAKKMVIKFCEIKKQRKVN